MHSSCFSYRKVPNLSSRRCEQASNVVSLFYNVFYRFLSLQGDEQETLNILRKIYKLNNPKSDVEYNVTKVVEDLEFIDNDSREITNVSENPFVMFWNQTCLLFSKKNVKKTVLICLMQASLRMKFCLYIGEVWRGY